MHKNYDLNLQLNILNKINEKSRRVRFEPKEHKYFLDTFELTSVTTFIDKYRSPFESYKIANSLANKFNEKHGIKNTINERKPDYYIQLWNANRDMACARGTMIHLYAESFPFFDELKLKEHAFIHNYFTDLSEDYIYVGSEIKVYSTKLKLAGTIDCILYNKYTKKLKLVDWKTNSDIYKKQSGYMLEPFQDFRNTKVNGYTLQLNFYKQCLEEMFNKKDIIEGLELVWLQETNENYEIIPLQMLNLNKYLK